MKSLATSTLPVILPLAAGACARTDTDEARAMAAQATARQEREASARPPVAERAAMLRAATAAR